jgi:phage terminase large subunit-like protein
MLDWSTACPDWEERIVKRQSLVPRPLFADEAEAALDVFKSLRIVDAPGSPTFGDACEEWVFDFVAAIFGAFHAETAERLISEFFLLISKKNAKSTIAAGIMVTALVRNWRMSAELLLLAPTKEVADNAFKPAADMIRADEDLKDLLGVQDHIRTITHKTTNAFLKVVAADSDTVSGKKASFVLVDELWVFGSKPHADAMLKEATGGLVSRPEGFVVYLSTQSDKPPAGVFKNKLEYARDVRDGKIHDPRFLPVIYEFPPEMVKRAEYLVPSNFYITNPNMGRSVSQAWLERELKKELAKDVGERATFLAKHLNVEIGRNLRANRWPGAEMWDDRADASLTMEEVLRRSEVVVVGVDGGGLDDLFGLVLLGRCRETKAWLAWAHAWCHDGVLTRRPAIATRLMEFKANGDLTIVDDELADISGIIEIIQIVKDAGLLASVSVDPAGLGELIDALAEIGVTQEEGLLIGAPQGYAMMNAIKTTERRVANGMLLHSGSPMMGWAVGNLKIEPTATAIRASKQNAGDDKIDPVMALFDAVTVMSRNPSAAAAGPNVNDFFASLGAA